MLEFPAGQAMSSNGRLPETAASGCVPKLSPGPTHLRPPQITAEQQARERVVRCKGPFRYWDRRPWEVLMRS